MLATAHSAQDQYIGSETTIRLFVLLHILILFRLRRQVERVGRRISNLCRCKLFDIQAIITKNIYFLNIFRIKFRCVKVLFANWLFHGKNVDFIEKSWNPRWPTENGLFLISPNHKKFHFRSVDTFRDTSVGGHFLPPPPPPGSRPWEPGGRGG